MDAILKAKAQLLNDAFKQAVLLNSENAQLGNTGGLSLFLLGLKERSAAYRLKLDRIDQGGDNTFINERVQLLAADLVTLGYLITKMARDAMSLSVVLNWQAGKEANPRDLPYELPIGGARVRLSAPLPGEMGKQRDQEVSAAASDVSASALLLWRAASVVQQAILAFTDDVTNAKELRLGSPFEVISGNAIVSRRIANTLEAMLNTFGQVSAMTRPVKLE